MKKELEEVMSTIQYILYSGDYTKEEAQEDLDGLLESELLFHRFDEAKLLVLAGAKIKNPFYETYIEDAGRMKFLIEKCGINVNIKDKEGMNLYAYADRAFFVTGKKRYKLVCDYLEHMGADKMTFSIEEKQHLRNHHLRCCEYIQKVRNGEIKRPIDLEFKMLEIHAKYGVVDYGEVERFRSKKSKEEKTL